MAERRLAVNKTATNMANEKEIPKPKKKKNILIIVIILVVLIIIASGAFYVVKSNILQKIENTQSEPKQSQSILEDQNVHIKNISDMIINLADISGDRYIKLSLSLVLNGKGMDKTSELNSKSLENIIIKNAIITVVSTKTTDSLSTVSGKQLLKKQLIKAINNALSDNLVKKIYFTNFIIQ